jgi:hypothetical protein
MILSRNLTTHTYNEKTAEEMALFIKTLYFPVITKLIQKLTAERARHNAIRNI